MHFQRWFLLLAALAVVPAQTPAPSIVGSWMGVLETGGPKLRIALHVSENALGGLEAKMDSLDQGARGIPVAKVAQDGAAVRLELPQLRASYEGTLQENDEITGTWRQGPGSLPLTFRRGEEPAPPRRPQEPQRPYPYIEVEVTYKVQSAGITLAGTLTLPKGKGPFPAALLITGSGPQNRDEEIAGHRPFLVIADHLTRRGFAVLRVDDRGVGKSTGGMADATTLDFVEDALAGVAFLKSRHEIDASRVGLIGHSEGGIVGAIAASKSDGIAFLVLMAATGVKGAEVLTMQADLMATAAGAPPAAREQSRILQQKLLAIAEQEEDREKVRAKARAELEPLIANAPEGQRQTIERAMDGQISGLTSPWMRFFLRYDPSEALRKVKCPVLAINGEKDLQVSPKQNLPAIRKALEEAGNSDVTVEELPGLNHMFQHADKGLPSEYGSIEETFAPAALNAILDWLEKRLRR